MPRPANPQTAEGRVITDAIARSEFTQAKLAEELDVTPGFISQFATGHRPVPWVTAERLAILLGLAPGQISAEYRRLQDHFGSSQLQRLDGDIIRAAVLLAKKSVGLATGEVLNVESDPELFAQAIRATLAKRQRMEDQGDAAESGSGNGEVGRARRAKEPEEARPKAGAAAGRARKRA